MADIYIPAYPVLPELPEGPRERFRVCQTYLGELCEMPDRYKVLDEQFHAEVTAAVAAVARPKAKKSRKVEDIQLPSEILGEERYAQIRGRYEPIVAAVVKHHQTERERVKELMNPAADLISLMPDPEAAWIKREVETVWSSTYSTQGFGAHSYARNDAEDRAQHYKISGLQAEVRVCWLRDEHPGERFWAKSDLARYEVWVRASEEDAEIARYKSGLSMKDWLQWCWDHGSNPRVFLPGLSYGLEDRLGVRIGGQLSG